MGCFGSRLDKRRDAAGDWNTVGTQFVGGEAHEFDKFPFDRVLWGLDTKVEPDTHFDIGDDMAANNEDQMKAVYKHIKELSTKYHKEAADIAKSGKDSLIGGKWKASEVEAHWADFQAKFAEHSGLEEAAAEKKEGEEDAKDVEMSGGEEEDAEKKADPEMVGMGEMAGAASPFKYEEDARDYAGFKNLPALLLRNLIVNGSIFDRTKVTAVKWEFNSEKGPADAAWNQVAALVSAAAAKATTTEATIFISGWAGAEDKLSVDDIAGKSKNIHFPWVSVGWASAEEAVAAFEHGPQPKNAGDLHKVLFEVEKAAAFQFVNCRQVAHRLNGSIEAAGVAGDNGVTTYKVVAAAISAQSVADWTAALAAAGAAGAAGADKADDKKEEDAEKKDEGEAEKKDEGEMEKAE